MAEAVSAAIVVASLAAVTLNMAKMTRLLFKSQDPKVWTIGIRLAVEQARTEEWARRMGVNSNEDLERLKTQLPSESARVIVVTIWKGLSTWTEKATEKFESYGWDMADPESLTVLNTKNPRTLKGWANRYEWVATGYPDLLELVDTLTALNDGLEKIVPPPPGYQVHAVSAPKIASADNDVGFNFDAELINSAAYRRSTQSSPLLPNSIPRQNATPLAPSLPASALAQRPLSEVQNPPASQRSNPSSTLEAPSEAVSFHPTIEMLFSTCQKSLHYIVSQTHSASLRSIALRMKVLGLDYYGAAPTIDELLNPYVRPSKLLRKNIIGVLSDIGATLVHMLKSLKGKSNEEEMERQRNELVIVLGLDEIAQEALEEPAIMSPPYSAEFMEFCEVRLPGLLDCLYDTLFSIGTLRQIALAEKAERVPILAENMPQISIPERAADALPPTVAQATETSISVTVAGDQQAKARAQEQADAEQEAQRLERWANAVENSFKIGLTFQSATLQKAIYLNLNATATALREMSIKRSEKVNDILASIPHKVLDMGIVLPIDTPELCSNKERLAHIRACIDALSKLEFSIKSAACDAVPSVPQWHFNKQKPLSGKGKARHTQERELLVIV